MNTGDLSSTESASVTVLFLKNLATMVQSLIQRIRENKLDALYLFINESLRDSNEFDVFFNNLMAVLPNNWSINRVEIGHEFLSRTVAADQQQQADQAQANNNDQSDSPSKQDQLFQWVCSLESLRSLIISDGYIPRKDHGFLDTKAFLKNLPRANNLQYLDVQRLRLQSTSDVMENNNAEFLAESLHSLRDSLEDLRLTAISMCDTTKLATHVSHCEVECRKRRYPLDAAIRVCGDMANLQSLVMSCANGCGCKCDNGEDHQHNMHHHQLSLPPSDNSLSSASSSSSSSPFPAVSSCLISKEVLLYLCRSSTTLQELALRSMRIDDDTCKTIAKAFDPPSTAKLTSSTSSASLTSMLPGNHAGDEAETDDENDSNGENHHSPSFWTSLDLRQNPFIGTEGYNAILSSLERNYDLWCSLMVDNESFQSKFNALIELNQANRGSLVRSPSTEKLAVFLDRLKDDPTALWYFLTIHRDSILLPLIRYLTWKNSISASRPVAMRREQQQEQEGGYKRTADEALAVHPLQQPTIPMDTPTQHSSATNNSGTNLSHKMKNNHETDDCGEIEVKRLRQSEN